MDRWQDASAATWNRHLSALVSFTAWAQRQELLATNSARRLERRKTSRRGNRAIPRARLEALFADRWVASGASTSHQMRSTECDEMGTEPPGSARLRLAAGVPLLRPEEQVVRGDADRPAQPAAGPQPGPLHDRRAGEAGAGARPALRGVPVAVDAPARRRVVHRHPGGARQRPVPRCGPAGRHCGRFAPIWSPRPMGGPSSARPGSTPTRCRWSPRSTPPSTCRSTWANRPSGPSPSRSWRRSSTMPTSR